MLCTGFIYCIGLSGFFVEIRGGVTLYLAFLMTFMGTPHPPLDLIVSTKRFISQCVH